MAVLSFRGRVKRGTIRGGRGEERSEEREGRAREGGKRKREDLGRIPLIREKLQKRDSLVPVFPKNAKN